MRPGARNGFHGIRLCAHGVYCQLIGCAPQGVIEEVGRCNTALSHRPDPSTQRPRRQNTAASALGTNSLRVRVIADMAPDSMPPGDLSSQQAHRAGAIEWAAPITARARGYSMPSGLVLPT